MIRMAKRWQSLPPYMFDEVDKAAQRAAEKGLEVISMGIGDPDRDPPLWIRELLAEEALREGSHRYPGYKGHPELLEAAQAFLTRRFGVNGLSRDNVAVTGGSKTGLAKLARALISPGDSFIAPDTLYPVFSTMSKLGGASEITVPMTPGNNFMPELGEELSEHQMRCARVMYINYPHNPTGRAARDKYLQGIVNFCLDNHIILVSDLAYSEIYYGPDNKPSSLLEFKGAIDCTIELHSFSKSFNMTGWRCGFAVGDPKLISALVRVETNTDGGVFNAIQLSLARMLRDGRCDGFLAENREHYLRRLEKVLAALDEMGITYHRPGGAIYVWCELPEGQHDSIKWVSELLDSTGLVVSPGRGYGPGGEGFFRLSLSAPDTVIDEAMSRLAGFLKG